MKGIIDTTLREGSQTIGVSFSFEQKLAIVKALSLVGIEEIELGICTKLDYELPKLLNASRKMAPQTSYSLWCRCNKEDISLAGRLSPDALSLSIPVSDIHIENKLEKNRTWVEKTARDSICFAKQCGIKKISLGLEDATRAHPDFLTKIIAIAAKNGAQRVRLADTVGIATPTTIIELLKKTQTHGLEIGVHCHNDFGMATANSITALQHGAHWADCTILGLGERAGNARTEEVAGFLALQAGSAYKTQRLYNICEQIAQIASKKIDPHHPIIGRNIFSCETGLHLQGLEKDPRTYEPYNPKRVGAVRRLIYGSKIGRRGLKQRLIALDIPTTPVIVERTLQIFRRKSKEFDRPLTDKELTAICLL